MYGASLGDPDKLFNAELAGNQRRAISVHEGDRIEAASLKVLVCVAIDYNQARGRK